MKLRLLEKKDAPLMLEWMHDEDVTKNLAANFAAKELGDCEAFIEAAQDCSEDMHMAIVDENDEYMGTVSLKHIHDLKAEFAITIRKAAMGKGYSAWGMKEILNKGLSELGLETIYWCVSKENARAVRFYDKNGYKRVTDVPGDITKNYTEDQLSEFYWYKVV